MEFLDRLGDESDRIIDSGTLSVRTSDVDHLTISIKSL
jgi:hypothetical protein